jgi:predicted ATPase/serine phosphatase RsbU (regulator of sigma subunit)/tRNA A-37 threonylcarbamoyl transferase component Bud32
MEKIQDYIITEKIAETRGSLVYRGHKEGSSRAVIIKVMKAKYPTVSEIARFKQEYELIKSINLVNVIRTHELLEYGDSFALVLEDFSGISIKSMLDQKNKFDIKTLLPLSAKIAETLGSLHAKDIVHKDIKPHNILINSKTGEIKITDFGISAVITHEHDEVYNPEYITGTLSYMSPEQTGRINRTVDYRTDLYSLGVTMYEMALGTLPFKSLDPLEIIHSHIAVMPVSPSVLDPEIPIVVSDIIMKLLSKTPEERYQNGFGAAADLSECSRQMDREGVIKTFPIARHDISNRFIIPQKLFGRDKEIETLLASFENVLNWGMGAGILAVSGAPGIGKSALVHEIHKPIVAKKGYFISGKYEQFRRDKPYSAIIQAFQSLIRQILSESEDMIRIWRKDIRDALAANGKVITDVIPDIELIIGTQPDLQALGPVETRNRFIYVFQKFINVFTAKGNPVVLFLDDLQWADRASLDLMLSILKNSGIRNFFLIVSYRDVLADEQQRIEDFLLEIEKYKIEISRVALGPITAEDIQNLIMNFLKCSSERGSELARLVHAKTGGNPFFVNQFLHTLYNDKMIVPDSALGWKWDIDRINRMQVTDNLVDMMSDKIGKLSRKTQDVLKICACIGNRFDLETIALVRGTSVFQALLDLTEAIHNGLISQLGNIYIFHHDRIQEAAYSLIDDLEKSELHYRIGKLALEAADEKVLQEKLFYIVDQLNLGSAMISDPGERTGIARLNLYAGKKAKASAAYAPAFRYLKTGIGLLETNAWDGQYELALALYSESAEASYLMGDYYAMNELAGQVLEHARTILDKVDIFITKINACTAQEDFKGAIDVALPFAKQLGYKTPKKLNQARIALELLKTQTAYRRKKTEELLNLPRMNDPGYLALSRILTHVAHASFYANPNLLAFIALERMRVYLKHGYPPDAPSNFVFYGMILAVGLMDFAGAKKYAEIGLKLMEKLGSRDRESMTTFIYNGLVRHWVDPIKNTIPPLLEGYRIGMETGDLNFAGFNLFFADSHTLYAGKELPEIERNSAKINRIIAGLNQKHLLTLQSLSWQSLLNLMGDCEDPLILSGKAINAEKMLPVWASVDNRAALSTYWYIKLVHYVYYNEYDRAREASDTFDQYKESMQGVVLNRHALLCDSIARLFSYRGASLRKKIKYAIRVRVNQSKLKKMAESAPMNTIFMYHGVEFLYAWLVRGKNDRAEKELELAIQSCKKYDNTLDGAYFNELGAQFQLSRGNENRAREHMDAAYALYVKLGSKGLSNKLLKSHPKLAAAPAAAREVSETITDRFFTTTTTVAEALDLSTVMKASQAISGEIVLEKLLASMVRIVIENAGAQKGIIIFEENRKLLVEAEGSVDRNDITVLRSIPVDQHDGLSAAIVNYVARTRRTLILNNADTEGEFTDDPYISHNGTKSILCSPIINQGRLTGILYLENKLAAGVFTPQRLELLNILSSQIAISIDNAKLYDNLEEKVKERTKELKEAKDALWGELELAKKIQTVLLPKKPEIPGYEISAYMMPAREVGGDYYDFIRVGGKDWIIIGDVSGHGVTAGLIMMMAQTAIHSTLTQHPDILPSDLLSVINKTIVANVGKMEENKYMTLTALAVHEDGRFVYSGLHQDILVYRAKTGMAETVATNGSWIGIFEDIKDKLTDETLTLGTGDVMMLYTDGITEAWDKNVAGAHKHSEETMFGQERLAGIIRDHGVKPPEKIQNAILKELDNYTTDDDITIVLIKRLD